MMVKPGFLSSSDRQDRPSAHREAAGNAGGSLENGAKSPASTHGSAGDGPPPPSCSSPPWPSGASKPGKTTTETFEPDAR
jgi:hypothetical protein